MNEKIRLNLTEDRSHCISMLNLKNMDSNYKFYYDETNNIRKLRLKQNGTFNIPINEVNKNFVLAGICHVKKEDILDTQSLKNDLYLSKNSNEIKFKHIAKGTFIECLKSKKLNIFLDWLINNNLFIHYSTIDILYWSVIDILESSVEYYQQFRYDDLNYFKMLFYEIIKIDLNNFLKILSKYKYPNIVEKKRNKFLSELMVYVDKNKQTVIDDIDAVNEHSVLVLLDILKNAKNNELTFIENNIEFELINSFNHFYQRPLGLFNNSQHIFDEEEEIMKEFNKYDFFDNEKKLNNFSFEESHQNDLIQFSDVIVGVLGKYFTFINELKFRDITSIKNKLDDTQKETLTKLFKLLIKSELRSDALIHNISPLSTIEKGKLLAQEFIN